MVYFTAVVDDDGKVSTFADVYGLDRKLAAALFGDTAGFPPPPPDSKPTETQEASVRHVRHDGAGAAPVLLPHLASSTIRLTPLASRVWRGSPSQALMLA